MEKDLLLHWSFVSRNMKAGMFSFYFPRDYTYFNIFCAAWIDVFLQLE